MYNFIPPLFSAPCIKQEHFSKLLPPLAKERQQSPSFLVPEHTSATLSTRAKRNLPSVQLLLYEEITTELHVLIEL